MADFAHWAGLPLTDARLGVESAKHSLSAINVDGRQFWMSASIPVKSRDGSGFALPGFDEFLLGYKDRSYTLHADHASKVVPGGNGVFRPTIVIDGVTVGTWRHTVRSSVLEITTQPFTKMTVDEHSLFAASATNYARFMGMKVKVLG